MTPEQAIDRIEELRQQLNKINSRLGREMDDLSESWAGLGAVGGQRADHAALLLARLRPHLAELARFSSAVETQLTGFVADPFGRERGAA